MSLVVFPGFPAAPQTGNPKQLWLWIKRIVDVVNSMLTGKLNNQLQITLRESETTTTITDARISGFSTFNLVEQTAHAAAAKYTSPYVLPSDQVAGSVVLNHASIAETDLTFNVIING